jgi:hypothetical protein
MSSPLEISVLKQVMVKPVAWKLVEHMDSLYTLEFTYSSPDRGGWSEVRTRRGEVKRYKTSNAVLSDIKRVQDSAVIYANFSAI